MIKIVGCMAIVLLVTAGESTAKPPSAATSPRFFQRLDTNQDGQVSLDEAPAEGKMLVEFLLHQAGKRQGDQLSRQDFAQVSATSDAAAESHNDHAAMAAAIVDGQVARASENCPACAMGLTAEFVFKRLDVNADQLITITEFRRSPGMDDQAKAAEVVGRLDNSGDGKLSWEELKTAYDLRHADCQKPDPAAIAANAEQMRPDGRGDGNRFAQVFMLRSDQNGDGKISESEFRGAAAGFQRLDKNKNGFIEVDELGELHQRRMNDPKSMQERLRDGDVKRPPAGQAPAGLNEGSQP